jgi:hypothetical protein
MKPPSSPPVQGGSPVSVNWLGYGGLLPFMGLAALSVLAPQESLWAVALNAYGAVILSFVGALHWAFAMLLSGLDARERNRCYAWSVIPALIGWVALLIPVSLGHTLLIAGLALAYWRDALLANRVALPLWYIRLRARLSIVACACLALASAGAIGRSVVL